MTYAYTTSFGKTDIPESSNFQFVVDEKEHLSCCLEYFLIFNLLSTCSAHSIERARFYSESDR